MNKFTDYEIERMEEIGDFYSTNGEVIPAYCFLQRDIKKTSLSLIPDYDDDEFIF